MAEAIKMPRMSDTMTEGVIVEWHKKAGDTIKPGDLLAEVETDKATMELESYNEGTILYIGVEAGQAAKVEDILLIVGKEGEDYKALLKKDANNEQPAIFSEKQETKNEKQETNNQQPASLPSGAKEIRMPLLSDTMTEGKIVAWHKKTGDFVKSDDVLAEVETDKATMEVVGYEEGTLLYIGVEAGQAAKVNQIIAIIGKPGTDVSAYIAAEKARQNNYIQTKTTEENKNHQQPETKNEKQKTNIWHPETDQRIKASPLAKKLAAEKGFDITKIKGSGDNGRVTKKDVDSYAPAEQTESSAKIPVNTFISAIKEGYTDVPLTQMRKTIARRLSESKFNAPHFYLTMEINMDNTINTRSVMNEVSPVKISLNDMIIKTCAMALRLHPDINSSWMGDFIRRNHHIHIGSAIALPEGLIVPVVRFADQKSLSQIAADAKELYSKAKDKKLQPAEFSGNTFTISNLGMMDIDEFTAVINPPDSAILAVGTIKEIVVKKGESVGVANMMKVTLSCDHRSIDGATGAAFLQTLKKFLENPVTMLV